MRDNQQKQTLKVIFLGQRGAHGWNAAPPWTMAACLVREVGRSLSHSIFEFWARGFKNLLPSFALDNTIQDNHAHLFVVCKEGVRVLCVFHQLLFPSNFTPPFLPLPHASPRSPFSPLSSSSPNPTHPLSQTTTKKQITKTQTLLLPPPLFIPSLFPLVFFPQTIHKIKGPPILPLFFFSSSFLARLSPSVHHSFFLLPSTPLSSFCPLSLISLS